MLAINYLREEVDVLDHQILYLLSKRMNVIKEIAIIKKKIGFPVIDLKREQQMKTKWRDNAHVLKIEHRPTEIILDEILKMSKKTQYKYINK
jgi:chorismate mutase